MLDVISILFRRAFFSLIGRLILLGTLIGLAPALPVVSHAKPIQLNVRMLPADADEQPQTKGDLFCFELKLNVKKTVCRYLPVNELAVNLQAAILRQFYGGRQPSDPESAYVRVLNSGILEFAEADERYVKGIIARLPLEDKLDTYVDRRKVNIVVQILQLREGADDSAGFLMGAQYSGSGRQSVTGKDRLVTTTTATGLVNFNFGFGNLVNTLLDVVLNNYKATNDIKVISSVPLTLTHGYQISNVTPYTKPIYVQTTSVTATAEQEGIRFEGQSRFHENANGKILLKDFSIIVSQFEPGVRKVDGIVEGVETFRSPPRDVELEIGCSTAIRVINVNRKATTKQKNFWISTKDEVNDTKKVFLFVIQAISDSTGTPASVECKESSAEADIVDKK